jgi:hypothetical protein
MGSNVPADPLDEELLRRHAEAQRDAENWDKRLNR